MIFLFLICIVTLSFTIILFPRLLVSLSTKALFICYFVSFVQVDKLTSLQVYELLVILYANPRSFILSFLQATCRLVDLSTRQLLPIINKKTLAGSQGFSGAYETRTRDLLRDRQAF